MERRAQMKGLYILRVKGYKGWYAERKENGAGAGQERVFAGPADEFEGVGGLPGPVAGDDLAGDEQCPGGEVDSAGDAGAGDSGGEEVRLPSQLLCAVAAKPEELFDWRAGSGAERRLLGAGDERH